jgi:DNA-binding NarL/FixJ family response regulator
MKDPHPPSPDRTQPLLIIDRSPVFAEGLRNVASATGIALDAIYTALPSELPNLLQALEYHHRPPKVLLMDGYFHPEFDCFELISRVRNANPGCEGILILRDLDDFLLRKAVDNSINVMVHREDSIEVFRHAIDAALTRSTYFSHTIARAIETSHHRERRARQETFSNREFDVLIRLGIGRPANSIAVELGLSPKTVATYRMRILQKLGLHNNADLCFYCLRHFPELLATHLGYHPSAINPGTERRTTGA